MARQKKPRIVAEVEPDLLKRANKIREYEGLTWIGLITKLLRDWVQQHEKKAN